MRTSDKNQASSFSPLAHSCSTCLVSGASAARERRRLESAGPASYEAPELAFRGTITLLIAIAACVVSYTSTVRGDRPAASGASPIAVAAHSAPRV